MLVSRCVKNNVYSVSAYPSYVFFVLILHTPFICILYTLLIN